MGSKPSKQDPFSRAETWLRQRKDAKIDAHDSSARSLLVRWPSLPSPFVETHCPEDVLCAKDIVYNVYRNS